MTVIETEVPWAEAILLNLGADKLTTMEYRELSPILDSTEQIRVPKLLGVFQVFVQSNFCCEEHVKNLSISCQSAAMRVYLMKLLGAKCLPPLSNNTFVRL